MTDEKVENLIREYLKHGGTRMMQVATCIDNQPWLFTCYYAYDNDLNIYWVSKPTDRHSKEIEINPQVAATIAYDQQPPRKDHRSVSFQGTAEQLRGLDAVKALAIYARQLASPKDWVKAVEMAQNPHRVYKLTVSEYVLYDDVNFPDSPRQVVAKA